MEYIDKKTGLIMYSAWWQSGKDFLKQNSIIVSQRDRLSIEIQRTTLLSYGWKEIKPVKLLVKCDCSK